jgi:SAM-dependent methyltransferase
MNELATKSFLRRHLPPGMKTFFISRKNLLKANIADMMHGREPGLPLPPARLRFRVHGATDRESFLQVGQNCAGDLKNALHRADIAFDSLTDILDFGCGCGRVLRYLYNPSAPQRFSGSDIDPESIQWCQRNLPFATFKTNGPKPPLSFSPKQFDFIYAISVFTHFDEDFQFAWLNELKRIARPGAIIIATTHGSYTHTALDAQARERLADTGFLHAVGATGRFKIEGLPDFYQTSYHTEKYIRSNWNKVFRVRSYIERGMNSHQDLVVLQNE